MPTELDDFDDLSIGNAIRERREAGIGWCHPIRVYDVGKRLDQIIDMVRKQFAENI